jgi:hypothetical protein
MRPKAKNAQLRLVSHGPRLWLPSLKMKPVCMPCHVEGEIHSALCSNEQTTALRMAFAVSIKTRSLRASEAGQG